MLLNFVHLYKLGENIFADLGFTLILLQLYAPESNKEYNFFFFKQQTRLDKDLPRPNFFSLGLKSCRIY